MLLVLETHSRDSLAELNPVANSVIQRWILLTHDVNHLTAIHRLHHLALIRLTETGDKHITEILLLHEILVQLLNMGHLVVVVYFAQNGEKASEKLCEGRRER